MAVFIFAHAMTFNAPWMRVNVVALAAPLVTAILVTEPANATGAA